jgi:predicted GNAT superfamily acetyltransferase
MTSLTVDAASAMALANRAAEHSGVEMRVLPDLADLEAVVSLLHGIWQPDPNNPLVTVEMLRALAHSGNYVAGAFDDGGMVGACFAFLAAPPGAALHSHVAGVALKARGRGIGAALKLHQRAWAISCGLSQITWTFDPLVRRNAYFNLLKLGARPTEYLVDFYGEITDAINVGQGTDRLLLQWDITSAAVAEACRGNGQEFDSGALLDREAVPALRMSETGRPEVLSGESRRSGRIALVQVPPDIEAVRQADPPLAIEWRHAVREVLGEFLDAGAHVVGFTRDGWYVVERKS